MLSFASGRARVFDPSGVPLGSSRDVFDVLSTEEPAGGSSVSTVSSGGFVVVGNSSESNRRRAGYPMYGTKVWTRQIGFGGAWQASSRPLVINRGYFQETHPRGTITLSTSRASAALWSYRLQ